MTAIYLCFFFFNDTATTEIYTLSLHDALPICPLIQADQEGCDVAHCWPTFFHSAARLSRSASLVASRARGRTLTTDRKSTRLNSSHLVISYAVFCLKKKKQ